ncbi:hypothetical protein, partial [Burkholderia sp. SIMBA_024]|uniref:hypothetical protein n=1 Tax=Burkholderia sp. SIMBA_024 TaxID=3085768 RepID=UPI00397C86AE
LGNWFQFSEPPRSPCVGASQTRASSFANIAAPHGPEVWDCFLRFQFSYGKVHERIRASGRRQTLGERR